MKKLWLLLFVLLPVVGSGQIITTFAGNGIVGHSGDSGPATIAKLAHPVGVNFDNTGNLLFGQSLLVRKVDLSTNLISTIAGDTTTAINGDGGPATNAHVNMPYVVCVDATGNFYIADYWAVTIRKVDIVTGIISRYVGTTYAAGSTGDGGPATAAKIGGASGMCIDTFRRILYFSDQWNRKVRQVDMVTGIVTTFAGTGVSGFGGDGGPASSAQLSRTDGICLDRFGNVYVNDWDNARIRKIDIATLVITTIAGNGALGYSGDGGPATNSKITRSLGMCFDTCDNLYFTDESNNCVRRIDAATNIITTVAGNSIAGYAGDGGPATAAQFDHPAGLCIDKGGNLFVGDYYNHRIRKIFADTASCYHPNITLDIAIGENTQISISPNPTTTTLTISAPGKIKEVCVYNLHGQIAAQRVVSGEREFHVEVAHLPVGMYLLKLVDDNGGVVVRRFVKE